MLARPAVLLTATTPEPRLPRSAPFWCDASPFRINTTKSVSKQTTSTLFRMNTYGKHTGWGRGTILPSSNLSLVTRHWTQVLSFHILPHSFARFCIHAKFNPFLFKRFLTLCQEKTPGVGADQKRRRPSRSDGGICEKGVPSSGEKIVDRLTVTKNIDRLTVTKAIDRLTVAKNVVAVQSSGGGGGGGTFVRNFP